MISGFHRTIRAKQLGLQRAYRQPDRHLTKEQRMPEIDHRMTELEIRYTHLVRLIDELNDVVTECNQRISQLEKDNGRLQEMVRAFAPEMSESPDE